MVFSWLLFSGVTFASPKEFPSDILGHELIIEKVISPFRDSMDALARNALFDRENNRFRLIFKSDSECPMVSGHVLRERSEKKLVERFVLNGCRGQSFALQLTRMGSSILETSDEDMVRLKLPGFEGADYYRLDLSINDFSFEFKKNSSGEWAGNGRMKFDDSNVLNFFYTEKVRSTFRQRTFHFYPLQSEDWDGYLMTRIDDIGTYQVDTYWMNQMPYAISRSTFYEMSVLKIFNQVYQFLQSVMSIHGWPSVSSALQLINF